MNAIFRFQIIIYSNYFIMLINYFVKKSSFKKKIKSIEEDFTSPINHQDIEETKDINHVVLKLESYEEYGSSSSSRGNHQKSYYL
jgi:hypothetical protein